MDRSLADLLIGRVIVGRYRIDEVIGRGGMSVVYRAQDERLGRPVALKVISFPREGDEATDDLRERLRREAAAAARIPPHPNVVQIYDHGSDSELGVDFIAMELLRGHDLKALLRLKRPAPAEALEMIGAAARGVAAGPRVGILHRDVKPSNIILTEEGRPDSLKIVDFGIAKALSAAEDDDLTRTGQSPHSPAYASPEQVNGGAGALTPASDVYQLGLIAYELLAGARPFDRAEQERIRSGDALPLPTRGEWGSVPVHVRSVVERALNAQPEQRFVDAAAFESALTEVPDDATTLLMADQSPASPRAEPTAQPIPSAPSRVGRSMVPRRAAVAGAALAGLLGIWAVSRAVDSSDSAPDTVLGAAETAALDQEFRELEAQAARNLAERAPDSGAAADQAVQTVIRSLTESWVLGDIDDHARHYAERVDFYGTRVSLDDVARSRRESVAAYPERDISIDRTAVTFPAPGQARALVDKSWNFKGDGGMWIGSGRVEYDLELQNGEWKVVGERETDRYSETRS